MSISTFFSLRPPSYYSVPQEPSPQEDSLPLYTHFKPIDPQLVAKEDESLKEVLWRLIDEAHLPNLTPTEAKHNMLILLCVIYALKPVTKLSQWERFHNKIIPYSIPHQVCHPYYSDMQGKMEKIWLSELSQYLVDTAQRKKFTSGLNIYEITYGLLIAEFLITQTNTNTAGTEENAAISYYIFTLRQTTDAAWNRLFSVQPPHEERKNWISANHQQALFDATAGQPTATFPKYEGPVSINAEQEEIAARVYQKFIESLLKVNPEFPNQTIIPPIDPNKKRIKQLFDK